jgi:formylmethanofuran dehydrogenase subunit A
MFATPRYVIKGGCIVVEEGHLRLAPEGRRLHVRPGYDAAVTLDIKRWFDANGTVAFENYPVAPPPGEPVGGARGEG